LLWIEENPAAGSPAPTDKPARVPASPHPQQRTHASTSNANWRLHYPFRRTSIARHLSLRLAASIEEATASLIFRLILIGIDHLAAQSTMRSASMSPDAGDSRLPPQSLPSARRGDVLG